MYNNTIGSIVMLVMCMIWKSTVYTIEIEINRAIDKSKPIKETCVNIPTVPLEFQLDPSNSKVVGMSKYSDATTKE